MQTSDFSAIPSALGYFYQVRYALLLFLQEGPDTVITLEKLDDVAFEKSGDAKELLQFKHHIEQTASLSDSSSDIWKTLRVWSTGLVDGQYDLDLCRLSLVTTGAAVPQSAAMFLRPEGTRNVGKALELLTTVAEQSISKINAPSYKAFLALTAEQRRALLDIVIVFDQAPNIESVGQQLERILRPAASAGHLRPFRERLEGWWFSRVIADWCRTDRQGGISRRELEAHLDDLRSQFHRESLPADFTEKISVTEDKLPKGSSLFLQQLKKVGVGNERIQDAMSDFFRAYEQRSRWVREELVWQGEMEQYDERLIDEWSRLFYAMKEDSANLPADERTRRGRSLYTALLDSQRHIRIRPGFDHPYVWRGSYHILANMPWVCWHPDMESQLARKTAAVSGVKRQ